MIIEGPDWHRSPQKLALENALLHISEPLITIELNRCLATGIYLGKTALVQQRVETLDVETGRMTFVGVGKMETLDTATMPLESGKKAEANLPTFIEDFRRTGGDEALQLLQTTWDLKRPGKLALVSTRPQMDEELEHMAATLSNHGYSNEFSAYVRRYSRMKKGYMSNESFIGFDHQRDSLDRYLERCAKNEEYFEKGSAKLDLKIFTKFLFGGFMMRTSYGGEIELHSSMEVEVFKRLRSILD